MLLGSKMPSFESFFLKNTQFRQKCLVLFLTPEPKNAYYKFVCYVCVYLSVCQSACACLQHLSAKRMKGFDFFVLFKRYFKGSNGVLNIPKYFKCVHGTTKKQAMIIKIVSVWRKKWEFYLRVLKLWFSSRKICREVFNFVNFTQFYAYLR